MVPPGDAASPFFPTEPAVPAPCVLGSLEEGMELPVVVAGVPSFFMAGPPPVVLPFMLSPVVVFDPAGPPAFESPPAVFGDWANDMVLTSAKVAASPTIDLAFMFVSFRFCPYEAIRHQCVRSYARSEARWSGPAKCSKVNQTLQRKQHGGFR
jgi:hypothetical protein